MASCTSSHNNRSIIEISSDEEITVEMEDLDWQKQALEEKLQKKAKAKQERREKEAAERWEEVRKQREVEDQKRKEKEAKDWRRREGANQKKRQEDTEHQKNESMRSIQEELRWEEAKMRRSSLEKVIGFGTPRGSLGPHWVPELGGSDGWSTWNGRIRSLLMTGVSVVRCRGTSVWKRIVKVENLAKGRASGVVQTAKSA
ncbi:hypothetical protein K439DRAFT_1618751 [Ramaria rubella]|nr:hypothetical protein K439DRAFT_1618751 [Ramaria rubella]